MGRGSVAVAQPPHEGEPKPAEIHKPSLQARHVFELAVSRGVLVVVEADGKSGRDLFQGGEK